MSSDGCVVLQKHGSTACVVDRFIPAGVKRLADCNTCRRCTALQLATVNLTGHLPPIRHPVQAIRFSPWRVFLMQIV